MNVCTLLYWLLNLPVAAAVVVDAWAEMLDTGVVDGWVYR